MFIVDRINGNGTVDVVSPDNLNALYRNVSCNGFNLRKGDLVFANGNVTVVTAVR